MPQQPYVFCTQNHHAIITMAKNAKATARKVFFLYLKKGIFRFLMKTTRKKLVAMVTTKTKNTNRPHKFFARYISEQFPEVLWRLRKY